MAGDKPPIASQSANPIDREQRMHSEVLCEVEMADEGGYVATAASHGILTQADSIEDLYAQVRNAVACDFDAADRPKLIRLRFVHDEMLAP